MWIKTKENNTVHILNTEYIDEIIIEEEEIKIWSSLAINYNYLIQKYDSAERANEVMKEIEESIISEKNFYSVPES